jgi:hypothetical protein
MAAIVILLVGCASDGQPKYSSGDYFIMPNSDDASTAPGDAWTGSSMYPRKQMPKHGREPANDWEFYFKHCSMNGNESYFSKTSYDCSGPYY